MRIVLFLMSFMVVALFEGCERLPVTPPGQDTFPPAVPSGLMVSYEADGEVELFWEDNYEPDIESYSIYRKTDSAGSVYVLAGQTFRNYFFDTGLDYGTRYFYSILAEDISGNISALSDTVSARPVNLYAPRKPRNLLVYAHNFQESLTIQLSWALPFESDLQYFDIYRSADGAFLPDSSNKVGRSASTRFDDTTGLETGVEYYYKLIAVDKGGLTSVASSVNSDIILPLPEFVFPQNGAYLPRFYQVTVTGIPFNSTYRLLLQSSEVAGVLWSTEYYHNGNTGEVIIPLQTYYLVANRDYYLRIETYRKSELFPNGITNAVKFAVKS